MNIVYVATSLDGYIADREGSVDWLPDPDEAGADTGFSTFIAGIDAIVMGRRTFDTVASFGGDWPYPCPVFVLSNTLDAVPDTLADRVEIAAGAPHEIVALLRMRGLETLYIDGGAVIQTFLAAGLIDKLILTRVPVLLGGGTPLFADLEGPLRFAHYETRTLPLGLVQSTYTKVAA